VQRLVDDPKLHVSKRRNGATIVVVRVADRDPLNWPFRLKNDVVPLPLLTADPLNWPFRSVYVWVLP
jgi:hypothetical protein